MICRAIEVGPPALSCLRSESGCVNAIFSSGLSLFYPPYSIVLIEDQYATPFGITVEGMKPLRRQVEPGWLAKWRHNSLFIGDIELSFSDVLIRHDLHQTILYNSSSTTRMNAEKKIVKFLHSYKKMTPLTSIFFPADTSLEKWEESFAREKFKTLLSTMLCAVHQGDIQAASEKAACFCGLGMGLTPAGDDFLTGMIALLNTLKLEEKKHNFTKDLLTELERRLSPEHTNSWGWSFVKPSFDRWQSALLTEAMFDILQGDNDQAIYRLAGIGSSSGLDQLCGILAGLKVIEALPF